MTTTIFAPLPYPRLFAAYWAETRCEFLRMGRNLALGAPLLLVPVAIYMLVALAVAADGITADPPLADYLFSGFSVLAVAMPGLFSIGCTLALERDTGLFKLKRALPAPAGAWLVAKLATAVVFAALAYLPILVVGAMWGRLTMSGSGLAAISAVLIAGSIPFAAIGLLIGALVSGSSAPGWANLFFLPCIYLSGLFLPLPKSMHAQTVLWPAFHLNQCALAAGGVEKYRFLPPMIAVAALLGVTVACGGFAIWRLARRG